MTEPMTAMDHWDKPVLTVDSTVYIECTSCGNSGPHPCEEVLGVLVVHCVVCGYEFGWTLR